MTAGGARTPLLIGLGLALLASALFWPATGYEFLNLDDDRYVTENPNLERGLSADGLRWAVSTDHEAVWIPATWISFMADRQFFGPGPVGFHRTNVLLHALNTLLLFIVLRTWTGALWRSALAAALFAVHPLNVEPVAWVTGRKDVLFMFFGLGSLIYWARWLRRQTPVALVACFLLGVLSMAAKPMGVVLPVVMFLMTRWPAQKSTDDLGRINGRRLAISLIPLVLCAAVVAVVARQTAISGEFGPPAHVPVLERFGRAAVFAVTYLRRILWPTGLCIHYPVDTLFWGRPAMIGSVGLMGGLTLGAWWARYRAGWFMTGWAWFLLGLVPVLDLVQGGQQLLSDRYVYLPAIGITLILAWTLEWLARRTWMPPRVPVGAGVVLVAVLAVVSAGQLPSWQSNVTAYDRALAVTRDNYRVHLSLANHYDETGQPGEALQHARRAVAIKESATGFYNLGNILFRLDRTHQARQAFEDAVRLDPTLARAHSNLGMIAGNEGRPVAAEEHFRRALEIDPGLVVARYNLAQLLAMLDRREEARLELRTVLSLDPDHAGARSLAAHLANDK
jgi:Flp pilus assembly protein TadD